MRGRLNLFQATMLRWRDLYPYAAVHMVRVQRPCEPQRLRDKIEELLESAGLTGLVLDRQRARFEFRGGPAAIDLRLLRGESTHGMAEAEIERQLNTAFPLEGRFSPFRFFAVDRGASFDLGLAYDHFLAGGDSIAVLLGHCVDAYCTEGPGAATSWTPGLYPPTYRRLFLRRLASVARGLAHLPSLAKSCRRSWRAPCHGDRDARNAFLCFRVDPARLEALRRTARSWQVTIGDLFLAMLLSALDPITSERRTAERRSELAVASIVNLRGEFASAADASFGQFLSSLRFSHPVPAAMSLRELAAEIHVETTRVRTRRLYLQTLLALGAAGLGWRFLSTEQRRGFLAKHYPIWAGVSAVLVDPLWEGIRRPVPASEYLRAVSTGPLAPIVLAITTLGDALWVGVTFRTADVTRTTAEAVTQNFQRCVASLA